MKRYVIFALFSVFLSFQSNGLVLADDTSQPKSAADYVRRANLQAGRGDFDGAIADY
jgi:hypothetical protein